MFISRWRGYQIIVFAFHGMLRNKKEHTTDKYNVDGPQNCAEWKLDIEKYLLYDCIYAWYDILEQMTLKLRYFTYLMRRASSLEKTLMLGKIEGSGEGDNRGWDGWMASLTQWTWIWTNSEIVKDRGPWCVAEPEITKSWTRLSNWAGLHMVSHV